MKIAVIGNFSDRKCGFQNFSMQTVTALNRAGHDVHGYDGTYSVVYARREAGQESFLPPDFNSYDVLHVIWHPATMNHYSGAPWGDVRAVKSVWNGCPAAWCPFNDQMDVKWGVLGREEGHRQLWYPIPDWVDDLPDPSPRFTVGYSGVRGDGVPLLTEVCLSHNWQMNFSDPAVWLSQEDEIRRLAQSTVNVGWYGAVHDDRSGSAMVCMASRRPFLCNNVSMFTHLQPYSGATFPEIYMRPNHPAELAFALTAVYNDWVNGRPLHQPKTILDDLSWSRAADELTKGWQACLDAAV